MKSTFNRQHCRMVLVLFLLELSLLSACTIRDQPLQINHPPDSIRKDGTLDFFNPDKSIKASITIEVADTTESQMKGLMERSTLDDNSGMLFVFQRQELRKFWMKDTTIPLDIIFIGGDGCITNIVESATPMSDQRYNSSEPIKYVVEVRAGFAKRFQLDTNTCIQWKRW